MGCQLGPRASQLQRQEWEKEAYWVKEKVVAGISLPCSRDHREALWPEGRTEAHRGGKIRARTGPELSKAPVPGYDQLGPIFWV